MKNINFRQKFNVMIELAKTVTNDVDTDDFCQRLASGSGDENNVNYYKQNIELIAQQGMNTIYPDWMDLSEEAVKATDTEIDKYVNILMEMFDEDQKNKFNDKLIALMNVKESVDNEMEEYFQDKLSNMDESKKSEMSKYIGELPKTEYYNSLDNNNIYSDGLIIILENHILKQKMKEAAKPTTTKRNKI